MAKLKDLTGKRYGKLTVIKFAGRTPYKMALWECVCDCGNHCIVRAPDLKHGTVTSCGCSKPPRKEPRVYNDLTGMVTGRLTVLRRIKERTKDGASIWECACSCGNITKVSSVDLKHGRVKSCGCIQFEARKKCVANATKARPLKPKTGRFDTNAAARNWTIISPDGEEYTFRNLRNWLRNHADLFGIDGSDESIERASKGFCNLSMTLRGKMKYPCYSYKGWRLKYAPYPDEVGDGKI